LNIYTLHAELNPICHLLALLGAHHILHVSRVRVKGLYIINIACFAGEIITITITITITMHGLDSFKLATK
jgi:hypothetical protein